MDNQDIFQVLASTGYVLQPGKQLHPTGRNYERRNDGVTMDKILTMKPWGFKLEDISVEVHLWHGEADKVVPPAMGHFLADTIPNCRTKFIAEEGHFPLLPNHAQEILEVLVK